MNQLISGVAHDHLPTNQFLDKAYRTEKSRFLIHHGRWWYRGDDHQFVIATDEGRVVGHSAIVPTICMLDGQPQPSAWWVDLIVDPEFRGQGLQTILHEAVRSSGELRFAFPARDLSGKMFKKHGWRMREDCLHLTLLLTLMALPRIRQAQSLKGQLVRTAARAASPFFALLRWRLSRYHPHTAREVDAPDTSTLAQVFFRYPTPRTTTWRDAEYLQWRFLDAPYLSQLRFYLAGPADAPTHVLITRRLDLNVSAPAVFLDLFGDLEDSLGLSDIVRLAVRDAARERVDQIVSLSSVPKLTTVLQTVGFRMPRALQFCWHSPNETLMARFGEKDNHWTYADSDTDQ